MTSSTQIAAGCIYCGRPIYDPDQPNVTLTAEHIIAEGLGGTNVLPNASCKVCQDETSAIESQCILHLVGHARKDLKVFGRKAKARAKVGNESKPTLLPLFWFPYPRILLGQRPTIESFVSQIRLIPITPDFSKRLLLTGGSHTASYNPRHGGGLNAPSFARMIAKIGHAYAVQKLGRGAFEPLVTGFIRGIDPIDAIGNYIGCEVVDDPVAAKRFILTHRWESPLRSTGVEYLVVRVRLFAEFAAPTYVAVVGSRQTTGNPY